MMLTQSCSGVEKRLRELKHLFFYLLFMLTLMLYFRQTLSPGNVSLQINCIRNMFYRKHNRDWIMFHINMMRKCCKFMFLMSLVFLLHQHCWVPLFVLQVLFVPPGSGSRVFARFLWFKVLVLLTCLVMESISRTQRSCSVLMPKKQGNTPQPSQNSAKTHRSQGHTHDTHTLYTRITVIIICESEQD